MEIPKEVYMALKKVFVEIEKDSTKLTNLSLEYVGMEDERAFTVENLETIACNHAFDDNPSFFGITEREGWIIRGYFSSPPELTMKGIRTYDYVKDLREEFPDFFKTSESQEYMDYINRYRKEKGLKSLSFS